MSSLRSKVDAGWEFWLYFQWRSHFGQETVMVEMGKKENRSSGSYSVSLEKFLQVRCPHFIHLLPLGGCHSPWASKSSFPCHAMGVCHIRNKWPATQSGCDAKAGHHFDYACWNSPRITSCNLTCWFSRYISPMYWHSKWPATCTQTHTMMRSIMMMCVTKMFCKCMQLRWVRDVYMGWSVHLHM